MKWDGCKQNSKDNWRDVLTRTGGPLLAALVLVQATGCGDEMSMDADELTSASVSSPMRVVSAAEEERMSRYIADLYPQEQVRHTFSFGVNQLIDCVDMYAQPALRRPEMRGHQIQLAPTTPPTGPDTQVRLDAELVAPGAGDTDESGRVRRCPEGTVPVQRLTLTQLRRFRTLEDFRRKYPSHLRSTQGVLPLSQRNIQPPAIGSTDLHQYAVAYQTVDNWGAETRINLWNPYVEKTSEFSLSQMWVSRGSGANLETVEVGVQKYRDLYGDTTPRLFIYFTPDNYGSGGCYNMSCSAFVQTNSSITIGGPFGSFSTSGGTQYEFQILWYKDTATGHWWLRYNGTWIGYYPRSLFDANGLSNQGAFVEFGGEIIDDVPTRHTHTDMGSGAFPSTGWQYAAFHRTLRYVNTSGVYTDPSGLTAFRTDSRCYDIVLGNDPGNWGRYFFYGGPGYNANCQ